MQQVTWLKGLSITIALASTPLAHANTNNASTHSLTDISGVNIVDNSEDLESALTNCQFDEDAEAGCAILLKPGQYSLDSLSDIGIGYYTELSGLGAMPKDVSLDGLMVATNDYSAYTDTRTFFRSIENVELPSDFTWNVSQGTSLRRSIIDHDLTLSKDGISASGGFMANVSIRGALNTGTQQQWMSRHIDSDWIYSSSTWGDNGVFVNATDSSGKELNIDPASFNGSEQFNHFEQSDLSQSSNQPMTEKPYWVWDDKTNAPLIRVPTTDVATSQGSHLTDESASAVDINNQQYCVISADDSTAIDDCFSGNYQAVVFAPGQYHLNQTITQKGLVVMGLGYPRLIPQNPASPALSIQASSTKVADVMLEDSTLSDKTQQAPLLEVAGDATSGSTLYNVFVRLITKQSGTQVPSIDISQDETIGDNIWVWAKDINGAQQGTSDQGLLISGDDVTMLGLAVEHVGTSNLAQVKWTGNSGRNYFYQSELPYFNDASQLAPSFAVTGTNFLGVGLGVYSVVGNATMNSGVSVPSDSTIDMAFDWNIDNSSSSGHVSNIIEVGADNYPQPTEVNPDGAGSKNYYQPSS